MFKPTFLYVKTHNQTGLKYFGKTTSKDPFKYKGSGVYWTRHLAAHGNDVTTIIIGHFTDEVNCREAANKFCLDNNIVESKEWANIKLETLDGGFDHIHSKNLSRDYMIERWKNPSYREEMSEMSKLSWNDSRREAAVKAREEFWTPESRENMSKKMRGNKNSLGRKLPPRACITDGISDKFIALEQVDEFLKLNPDWRRGGKKREYPKTRKSRA